MPNITLEVNRTQRCPSVVRSRLSKRHSIQNLCPVMTKRIFFSWMISFAIPINFVMAHLQLFRHVKVEGGSPIKWRNVGAG